MAEIKKRLLVPSRRRAVPQSGFSWIDRRLVRDGFLSRLSGPEALLYFFLVVVADQDGLSYYGDRRTAAMLKLSEVALDNARRGLERKDLIQYRAPLYQVLSLPDILPTSSIATATLQPSSPTPMPADARPVGDILRRMLDARDPGSGGDAR